ncbi:MAG TPA: sigma-70 family RNA polymerase sigma factor [Noviherbaspirillum sp.]|jgi:RNA polymerase sigma factor (sigma-70 family)|uniref:RNA polymerase sigma factor n=1 Tax=Noviherbaspirillum sp. TaxID=1926288 RepID=UPI002F91C79A
MMPSRAALVEAAQGGQPDAIAALLTDCQPDIRRFARRACSRAEDAEDAVQTALWQLYRKIGALRTAATLAAWLFRIVERECFRLFRQRSRLELESEAEIESLAAPGVPLDLRLDLIRAVAALPAPYRVVLILRDIEELTAPEVASQLGLGLQAVKTRLHRARAMVRERLMESGYWSGVEGEDEQ